MSKRYRFFSNHTIKSFTEPSISRLELILITFVMGLGFSFGMFAFERDTRKKLTQELVEAQAEIRDLKAAETRRNAALPVSREGPSEAKTQTPGVHSHDHGDVATVFEDTSENTVAVMQSGPLKGVPMDVAKQIQEEYRAASVARATQHHEWELRRRAHKERDRALVKKELAHGEARLADSKKMREHILAVYASMSPEQLEAARKEALETQPLEFVDLFFEDVSAFSTSKSAEELVQDGEDLRRNKETLAIAWRALEVEREELDRERDELMRTKPPSPNVDFNAFYAEWKERNSMKALP